MSRKLLLILLLPLLISACGTPTTHRTPTLAQAHVGQVVKASSSLVQGRSLLLHARSILDAIILTSSDALTLARSQQFKRAKRRVVVAEEINEPADAFRHAHRPGLQSTIASARFHTQQAARTKDASATIRRHAPEIWRKANRILEDAARLASSIDAGLHAESTESLITSITETDLLARQISGQQLVAGGYNLDDFERDLQIMLASNNEQLTEADVWYLENFKLIRGSREWAFKQQTLNSHNNAVVQGNDNTGTRQGFAGDGKINDTTVNE